MNRLFDQAPGRLAPKGVSSFALAALLAGCAHVATVREGELSKVGADQNGVIFPVQLVSDDPTPIESGCKVELRAVDGIIDYPVDLKPGRQLIFAQLPEGNYHFQDFYCFGRRWDLTAKSWPNFRAYPGKIGVVDALEFRLSDAQTLYTHAANRKEAQKEISGIFGLIPDHSRGRVVDAYDGLPITPQLALWSATYGDHEIRKTPEGKVLGHDEAKRIGVPKFKACYQGEDWVNYLWVGNLKIRAHYRDAKLIEAVSLESPNTFTPHFAACAKSTISEFKPESKQELWYDFYL